MKKGLIVVIALMFLSACAAIGIENSSDKSDLVAGKYKNDIKQINLPTPASNGTY